MQDISLGMLRYAAGVPFPLRLAVRKEDGATSEFTTESSFAILGRGEGNDLQLPESTVSYRHVYLQAIGGGVACVDLLSTTGVKWDGPDFHGWMAPGQELRIGPNRIRLLDEHWRDQAGVPSPLEFKTREEQRQEYGLLPKVELELLNTSKKGARFPINRVITLLGRDERCRITFVDDRLSRVQCALLLLPSGLWVIDMLGKAPMQLGGQTSRCGLMTTGVELTIGKYQLTAHYPEAAAAAAAMPVQTVQGTEFATRSNRILQTEFYHDTIIVLPVGDSRSFFYQEIYVEANRIVDLINQRGFRNVVFDFRRLEEAGHLLLEAMMAICRATPGKTVLCGAGESLLSTLHSSPLARLCKHYGSCQEALQAVYLSP